MRRNTPTTPKIPMPAARRLCIYLRLLEKLTFMGKTSTSSFDISQHTGIPAYQVRKDINYLGEVGVVGRGYSIAALSSRISQKLESNRRRTCILAGMGSLGTALARYFGSTSSAFDLIAGFDTSKKKVGRALGGIPVHPLDRMPSIVRDHGVEIGIVAVPAGSAKSTAHAMVEAGVVGILNFSPVVLKLPSHIVKHDIDLLHEIEIVGFQLPRRGTSSRSAESPCHPGDPR